MSCGGKGTGSAAEFVPATRSIAAMRRSVDDCRGCGLWACGSGVFGEGPARARVMMVGEQPGDQEELAGRPFVGPAGRLLDDALAEAGIDRSAVYLTNAVKHFKFERVARGKRRIHKKPSDSEVRACHPWLMREIAVVRPRLVVLLGATAAQSLLGKSFRVTKQRGELLDVEFAEAAMATVHPSSVLRAPSATRAVDRAAFVRDLHRVAEFVGKR